MVLENLIYDKEDKKLSMSNLVIVESPAKCQKIQGFLGAGWRVIASMGHIRSLKQELAAVGIDNNFEPVYESIKNKSKAISQIKEAAKGATQIYLAADDDREGESIAYAVCVLLKLNPKTALRAVFHEITEKAVKKAIAEPRLLDMNRVHAQQSRAMLDMMLGFTLSPLLWRYIAPALSAGRCQTPALRLVVEREEQIRTFTATSSWHLRGTWSTQGVMDGFTFEADMEDDLEDEESAINYMDAIYQTSHGTIISNQMKQWSESAPLPLITSTLQQQASAMFSMNPKQTMSIAQKLYEGGHITYMRTDHAVLSEEAKTDAIFWVKENYGEEFVQSEVKVAKKAKVAKVKQEAQETQVAQEAHEAIRPTHMEVVEMTDNWTAYDKKVYHLIWQRAIQSVMSAAQGETIRVQLQIEGDTDFTWGAQWKRIVFEGWRRAGKVVDLEEESLMKDAVSLMKDAVSLMKDAVSLSKDAEWEKAAALQKGDCVSWQTIHALPKETKAQGRYTEATLIRELERNGIGRPSTFASLLSAIQDRQYVETTTIPAREIDIIEYSVVPKQWPATKKAVKKKVAAEKNKLIPTALGQSVLTFLLQHFTDLFEYDMTSHMEKRLDRIGEGAESWKDVLHDTWNSYKDRYNNLILGSQKIERPHAKVRSFTNGLKAVQSKKGPLLLIEGKDTQFIGWPAGVSFEEMTEKRALQFQEEEKEKKKGNEMGTWKDEIIVKKSGKFGTYLQCGGISIPFEEESLEKTIERFEAKKNGVIKSFTQYVIRTGPYGPYIMKTSLKKAQFVSLPKGIDVSALSEKEVEGLYKMGLDSKKKWKNVQGIKDAKKDAKKDAT
jgi:DNA topoisomerase-1